jgi:hypothetical protein
MKNDNLTSATDLETRRRREVLTLYGFAAFFVIAIIALGIDAVMSHA